MVVKRQKSLRSRPIRRSRTILILPVVGVVFGMATAGFATPQTTLKSAILQATEVDGQINAMRQIVASRTLDIQAARDTYFPSLSLSADSATTDSEGPGITLTVSQVLFDWGLIRSQIDAASHVRVQAVSDLKMAVEELTLQVSEYFIDVEVIDLKINRTRDYIAFARRISEQAASRALAGISDNGEVARARLEIARAEDQLAQLLANRSIAMSQLSYLTGRPVAAVVTAPSIGFATRYKEPSKLVAAIKIAPDYISARAGVAEAKAGVESAKASRMPTIRLQAQARADLNGGKSQTSVGISTGVDLNSSGLGRREVQSAKLDFDAARATLLHTERELRNSAMSSLQQVEILRQTENSSDQQLLEAQRVLENYEQQFIGGQRELLDILTTGRDLYDSQIDKIDTFQERKRTEYSAARDLGVLGTLILASS